jgi:hypothetical protein
MIDKREGGNYTQAVADPVHGIKYEVYVNWHYICTKYSASEAEEALLVAVSDYLATSRRPVRVGMNRP